MSHDPAGSNPANVVLPFEIRSKMVQKSEHCASAAQNKLGCPPMLDLSYQDSGGLAGWKRGLM